MATYDRRVVFLQNGIHIETYLQELAQVMDRKEIGSSIKLELILAGGNKISFTFNAKSKKWWQSFIL